MKKTISEKRKVFMNTLIGTFNKLDPSGVNTKYYKDFFESMSDTKFDSYIKDFFKDDKSNFYFEIVEYERTPSYDNIADAAKFLNVPLYERVYLKHINGETGEVVVTPHEVPVGYYHVKRMQEALFKKNSGSIYNTRRNPKTGQVTGKDKNARNTDVETFAMLAIGAEKALKELNGPRADDMLAKTQMYNKISNDGFVSLNDLNMEPENKVSLNTLDIYFMMMGIKTNLIHGKNVFISANNKKKRT